ncbi:MAG: tetratricopeptide repeat protein [Elusimicrobiota bacterium]|jgi:predicted TPR repeat methyltransferase
MKKITAVLGISASTAILFAAALFLRVEAGGQEGSARRSALLAQKAEVESALAQSGQDAELWRKLGLLNQHLGEPQQALAAFRKVVELLPEDSAGWFMLGLTYEKVGDRSSAADAWEKCLRFAANEKARETARRHLARLRP